MRRADLAAIDLFAGAGGLSLGATHSGVRVALAVDIDPSSCQTLEANRAHHLAAILRADVAQLTGDGLRRTAGLGRRDPLIVLGGPPCQPFSKAAYWLDPGDEARFRRLRAAGKHPRILSRAVAVRSDPRRNLIRHFLRLTIEARADGFVLENVPSLLHPRNQRLAKRLVTLAEADGYHVTVGILNAAEFGVPQARQRVFIVGSRYREPVLPRATHWLARPASNLSRAVTAGSVLERFRGTEYFEPEEVVAGRWARHLREVPPGGNYKAHTKWGGSAQPAFITETRFWNFLLKLSPERPSWTIPANPGPWTGPFHWDSRRLRTPELAALQGFPSEYEFVGTRRERVRQIGNAVPPGLASAVTDRAIAAVVARR